MRQKIHKTMLLLFIPILLLSNLIPVYASNIEHECNEDESSGHGTIAVTLNVTHIHEYDRTIVISPSCTTNGYTRYICSSCGYEKKDDIRLALGHAWDEDFNQNVLRCVRCNITKPIQSFDSNDNVNNNNNETIKPDTNKPNDSNSTGSNKNDSNKVETEVETELESEIKEPDTPESDGDDTNTGSTEGDNSTKNPQLPTEQNPIDEISTATKILIAIAVAATSIGTIVGVIYVFQIKKKP